MTRSITYTALPSVPLVNPGDDICQIIKDGLVAARIELQTGDIIVVAQKIVSKSENRYVYLESVIPSVRARELAAITGKDARHLEVVLSEARSVLRVKPNVIIVEHRLGFVMANAGIDESNIDAAKAHRVLLLPVNSDESCSQIKQRLDVEFNVNLGVIINDSFGRAWRNGVVGVALGSAGITSLFNMIGEPDLFGRPMVVTEVAIADEIAAAASLLMGQGAEGTPIIHIRGFRNPGPENNVASLIRPRELDMFR